MYALIVGRRSMARPQAWGIMARAIDSDTYITSHIDREFATNTNLPAWITTHLDWQDANSTG